MPDNNSIRSRKLRRESRNEVLDATPTTRAQLKATKANPDKPYKYFVKKTKQERPSEPTSSESVLYTPPEYQLDGISPANVIYANSRRRNTWPESLPESLNWLTQLCEFASSYTGAWVLTSTGVINDLLEAQIKQKGSPQMSQCLLMVLLFSSCLRVKETQYKFYKRVALYTNFFCDVLKGSCAGYTFITKLNSRYEFNGATVDGLIPLIYASFTHPYMPQFIKAKKSNHVVEVKVELDNESRVDVYLAYRNHMQVESNRIAKDWEEMGRDTTKFNQQLEQTLGYSATVGNLVLDCLSELYSRNDIGIKLQPLIKTTANLKGILCKLLESPMTSPRAFMVVQQLIRNRIMDPMEIEQCLPLIWNSLDEFLSVKMSDAQGGDEIDTTTKMRTLCRVLLLTALPKLEPPQQTVDLLRRYCRGEFSYDENSLLNLRIWHVVSKIPHIVLGDDFNDDSSLKDAPAFVKAVYKNYQDQRKRRSANSSSSMDES